MSSFDFTQGAASTTWTITHNLNVAETVNDVFVDVAGTLTKVLPLTVTHTNDNVLTITFSSAQDGVARVIG